MARLILKSPYIKSTGEAFGYLRYIATRERVELISDDRPPTRKQEQLIAKLVKDFPDSKTLYEYEDYLTKPTKVNASAFITLALEANWDSIHESEQYMKYIATRPRAERIGIHGLFGDEETVSLEKSMEELENYTGNVWTHVISLKREDAARLGFDNAAAWRNLIRAHRNDIAAAMKIPPGDFRWYAAFHDEGEHPHIHMMAWSAKPGQAYLSKEGIRQIKSKLTNDIFRRAMLELVQTMRDSMCDHPDAERLVLELAAQLETVKGKKSYGYLPKRLKKLVDEIVDEMERLPGVSRCYDQWLLLQGKVAAYYHDKPQERIPLSQQKEFRQIKNAVIQEAERLHLGEIGFEEKGLNQQDEPEEYRNASYDYWTLRDIIRDESLTMEERGEAVSEMEKLAESDDMYAQYLMGKLWRDGPLLIPDSVEARYWFEQAAEQGHLVAQYSLAKLYLSDDLEVRDTRTGMNWLYTAAVNGSHYAMYRLAKELFKGDLVKRNSDAAVEWFARSAERGNPYAQYMLGKLYLAGKEVPYDEEKAAYWLTQSAEQGNQYAQYLLNHLEENRPPSAMLAVTRLLHHMSRVFRDNSVPKSRPGGIQIDRKRLKKLQEKRMALGHKLDDHEEQWPNLTM